MKRPENIIDPKNYDKQQSFEKGFDAEIYYSYIKAQKYIDYLESEVKKFRLGAVIMASERLICDTCKSGLIDYPDIYRRTCRCGRLGYNVTD